MTGLLPRELDLLRSVFAKHLEIDRVLLFGSRAKGTFRKESDIDLAVSGITDGRALERLALELDDLPLPYLFDVKGLEGIRNPALVEHIRRIALPIYEREGEGQ